MHTFALLGCPLGHSISPALHRALFALSGYSGEYQLFELAPEILTAPETRQKLQRLTGFNVTIPHKQAIIPLLDEVEPSAGRFGAVNTVAVKQGRMTGYNTDATGFLHCMEGTPLGGRVCIAGAGGAAAVFAFCCGEAGGHVTFAVRPGGESRAVHLAQRMVLAGLPTPHIATAEMIAGAAEHYDLFINATPCGMYPRTDAMPVPADVLTRVGTVFDSIYNPAETQLMASAKAFGCRVIGGLDMLVRQGAEAHTIWYGARFTEAQLAAVKAQLAF